MLGDSGQGVSGTKEKIGSAICEVKKMRKEYFSPISCFRGKPGFPQRFNLKEEFLRFEKVQKGVQ